MECRLSVHVCGSHLSEVRNEQHLYLLSLITSENLKNLLIRQDILSADSELVIGLKCREVRRLYKNKALSLLILTMA